ncbi:MAG: M3 family oligoendopeptidase [Acidaminobacteraceae bacterium]
MPNFNEYKYERPDIKNLERLFKKSIVDFSTATSEDIQNEVLKTITSIRNNFETMSVLVNIRYTVDTNDKYYSSEMEYIDEITPIYEGLITEFYKALIVSDYRPELEAKWGNQLFDLADLQIKVFNDSIIEDKQNENKLVTEYSKLKASAKMIFDGEEKNLSQMQPYLESKDREIRKKAWDATTAFYLDNEKAFDDIYDKLVKLRHRMALKLGYENFVELGYDRLGRSDYDSKMIKGYREQVYNSIVPLAENLRARQARRLGFNSLKYYDIALDFISGNPSPKGDSNWIVDQGKSMYSEMSKETNEFFNFMLDNKLMDLEAKKGKDGGGYCTFVNDYKAPFIFSNFNGTSGDVDVLTHEAGHAFQVYRSRNQEMPEYVWPTYEACEIHSMSMEFLAWPWMENFFKEDVDKYKFSHLSSSLLFIPYGVSVDEFQHFVYENPKATPDERKAKWREIEKKYLPHRDYDENDFLERGGFWFRQSHIFADPFYYIDYTLAQVCAFEFWDKSNKDREKAWNDYLRLCDAGGSKPFLELVELAGLVNPFVDGSIAKITKPISDYLESVDDSKF